MVWAEPQDTWSMWALSGIGIRWEEEGERREGGREGVEERERGGEGWREGGKEKENKWSEGRVKVKGREKDGGNERERVGGKEGGNIQGSMKHTHTPTCGPCTGVMLSLPICPSSLSPQVYTSPSLVQHTQWREPQAMSTTALLARGPITLLGRR